MDTTGPARLRRFRDSRRISRERFARLLDVSASMLTKLERGESSPSLALACRIARLTESWREGAISPFEWIEIANDNDVPVPPAAEGAA